jgi:phosphoglycolate phosphatase-like HAD superfamily hydrolase
MKTQHVVWDWNGTLFDDLEARVEGMNIVCDAFDVPHINVATFRRHHTRPAKLFYEAVIGRTIDDQELQRCETVWLDHYEIARKTAALAPNALGIMEHLQSSGVTQSVLSMWQHRQLVPLARQLGVELYCIDIQGADDLLGLPKANYLQQHLEKLRASTGRTFMNASTLLIGDVTDDAIAAVASSVSIALVATGAETYEHLSDSGFPTFLTLDEVVNTIITP